MNTIALDIGKVCIEIDLKHCFTALGLPEKTEIPQVLLKSIEDMETGFIGEEEWLKTFASVTGNKFSDNELRKAYCMILGNERKEAVEFIKKALAHDIRVIFFSDTSPIHINQLFRDISFANLISGGIYSFEAGCRKPDSRIYQKYEETYGTPLIYIDDKIENIEAGKQAGWNSLLYQSSSTFIDAAKVLEL